MWCYHMVARPPPKELAPAEDGTAGCHGLLRRVVGGAQAVGHVVMVVGECGVGESVPAGHHHRHAHGMVQREGVQGLGDYGGVRACIDMDTSDAHRVPGCARAPHAAGLLGAGGGVVLRGDHVLHGYLTPSTSRQRAGTRVVHQGLHVTTRERVGGVWAARWAMTWWCAVPSPGQLPGTTWDAEGNTGIGYRACMGAMDCSCMGVGKVAGAAGTPPTLCGGLPKTPGCMPAIVAKLAAACEVMERGIEYPHRLTLKLKQISGISFFLIDPQELVVASARAQDYLFAVNPQSLHLQIHQRVNRSLLSSAQCSSLSCIQAQSAVRVGPGLRLRVADLRQTTPRHLKTA